MQRFFGWFVEHHLFVNVLALGIVIGGFTLIRDVPREYVPAVDTPTYFVTARLPGASARDVETKLTIPIEEAIDEIDGIETISSTASDGLSFSEVEFFFDLSPKQLEGGERDLREAIDQISDFPPEMEDEPEVERLQPGRWAVLEVALEGPRDDLVRAAKLLERRIEASPLISKVTTVGLPDPEVRVLVDPIKAREHGVTILDVVHAIDARNVSTTGGVMETPANRKQVVLWSRYEKPTDVIDTIIRGGPSGVVRVRDIARIEPGYEDVRLITHTNGQAGISLVVRKRDNADQIDAVDAIHEIVESAPLPESIHYSYVNDRAFFTRNRLDLMFNNGLIGGALVIGILFLFMRGRPAVWVTIGIPVVLMGGLAAIAATGMTLNLFTLTGLVIVLGMVVDDAVVVAENIVARREDGLLPREAATIGVTEMVRPVTAAALTTMLAFAPLTALGGLPGKVMWMMPAVVVLVLMFSLIESFLILPAHLSDLRDARAAERRRFVLVLEHYYRRGLAFALTHRALIVAIALAVLAFVMVVIRPLLPFVMFPQNDSRILFVKVTAPPGTPLEQTEAYVLGLERQIQRISAPDLNAITARIGHQDIQGSDKERGEAENEALISIVHKNLGRLHTNAEWIQILHQRLHVPPELDVVLESEFTGPPTDQPVTVHVKANDDALRRAVAIEIQNWLRAQPGLTEIQVDERPGTPQLDLNLNYEKLARYGLSAADVSSTLLASFHGIEASEHRDVEDTTELRVQFDPAARRNLEGLLDTPVRSAEGELVLLRDVVDPVTIPAVSRIFHRNGQRTATVRASFTPDSGLSSLAFAAIMERELLPRFASLPDVDIEIGGEAADTREITADLGQAALLTVLGITIVVWLLLGSLLEAVFVIVAIPFAFAGVLVAFFLHGLTLSMTAMMGAIGLSGVVVNASIVMIDSVHRRLRDRPENVDEQSVIIDAVVARLRPIVVTTLTTLVGVFPTAYGIGGYDILVSPMSIAIGWGLVFSTGVTLFLVPVLYSLAQDLKRTRQRRAAAAVAAT